jgi:hypothetical protein
MIKIEFGARKDKSAAEFVEMKSSLHLSKTDEIVTGHKADHVLNFSLPLATA